MRTAILYASSHGQTEKIARKIAETLAEAGIDAPVARCASPDAAQLLSEADAVIIGSSIHATRHHAKTAQLIRQNAEVLNGKPGAFFSVSLQASSDKEPERKQLAVLVDRFLADTGWKPTRVALVAGALPYSKYNLFIRFVLKQIVKSQGGPTDTSQDYEFTDWEQVAAFAREFGAEAGGAGQAES